MMDELDIITVNPNTLRHKRKIKLKNRAANKAARKARKIMRSRMK